MTEHALRELEDRITTALSERADLLTGDAIADALVEVPFVDRSSSARSPSGRRLLAAAALFAVIIVAVGALVTVHSSGTAPVAGPTLRTKLSCPVDGVSADGRTHGTMPPGGKGRPPEFIAAVDTHQNIVGFVRRPPSSGSVRVYGCDLSTVVGHLYPNRGFVPLGTDPRTMPTLVSPETMQRYENQLRHER
jgi:hypothetical protein